MTASAKDTLKTYLNDARDSLVWKTEGLSERELRLPRTPTGLTLLGIIKHALNVEATYFGVTFDRPWPAPEELVADETFDRDPQADWVAEADESAEHLLDLYARVRRFADTTIDELELDAVGHVPHWNGQAVTLHQILVHTTVDLVRHAGHADILREQIDGEVGLIRRSTNIPELDWAAHRARLQQIAEEFSD